MHDISEFDPRFDYRLTADDLRFHRWLRPYVPANASRFAAVVQQIDRDFATDAIRSWPEDSGRVWESEEGRERPEIPLNDRFAIAVERVLEDATLLDRLPAKQREALALRRLFTFWLLVNPDRDAVRLADGERLSEFQALRDCLNSGVGDSVPDEYVEPCPDSLCQNIKGDVLIVSSTSEVSWQAEAWIACAKDAAEALGVGPGHETVTVSTCEIGRAQEDAPWLRPMTPSELAKWIGECLGEGRTSSTCIRRYAKGAGVKPRKSKTDPYRVHEVERILNHVAGVKSPIGRAVRDAMG